MVTNGYGKQSRMPTMTQQTTLENSYSPISSKVVSSTPGRLRLRVAHSHRQPKEMQRIVKKLEANPNINEVRTNVHNGSITIQHDGDAKSSETVFTTLRDLGIIFSDLTDGKSDAAAEVSNAVFDLNKRVTKATNGAVDLRILFPLGLSALSIRQLLTRGLEFEVIPWYVLAWYAFDSFIKLHATSQKQTDYLNNEVNVK